MTAMFFTSIVRSSLLLLCHLNQYSISLTAAAANCRDSQTAATTPQFMDQCQNNPGAACPNRVPQSDCTAIYIDFFRVEICDFRARQSDCGKCFIYFEQVDFVLCFSCFVQ